MFIGGAKKNPLRAELLVFCIFQVYFFISCHVPWPYLKVYTQENTLGRDFSDKDSKMIL
jgi:hypothetical protein